LEELGSVTRSVAPKDASLRQGLSCVLGKTDEETSVRFFDYSGDQTNGVEIKSVSQLSLEEFHLRFSESHLFFYFADRIECNIGIVVFLSLIFFF
jgi:hypothetical protein